MVSLEVQDLGATDLHFLYSFAHIPKKMTIKTLQLVAVRFRLYKRGASYNDNSLNVIKSGVQTQARYRARHVDYESLTNSECWRVTNKLK